MENLEGPDNTFNTMIWEVEPMTNYAALDIIPLDISLMIVISLTLSSVWRYIFVV